MKKQDGISYHLLDCGHGKKLEKVGSWIIVRPCLQAIWEPTSPSLWKKVHATFSREKGWIEHESLPASWSIKLANILFKVTPTPFGHLGFFPEHASSYRWIQKQLQRAIPTNQPIRILNLFAYSGGASLAAALAGAFVCHVDASSPMNDWAKVNQSLNANSSDQIRWITEDVMRFVKREKRRGNKYEGIIIDPPTFGRGTKGEVFKIEKELAALLSLCSCLLSSRPRFVLLSCHTPGFTPLILRQLLYSIFPQIDAYQQIESGEMTIPLSPPYSLPQGTFVRWSAP